MKKRYIIGGCIAAAIAVGVFAARPAPVALPPHCWNASGFLPCDTPEEKAFLHGLDVIQHNFDVLRRGRLAAAAKACLARNGYDGLPLGANGSPRYVAYWAASDKCNGATKK